MDWYRESQASDIYIEPLRHTGEMDKAEATSLRKDLLALNGDIEVVTAVAYPSGEVLAVESCIPMGSDTSRKHFAILATVMRDHIEEFEEQYGRCNYFLFNFAQGQVMLFLTRNGVVVVGTKPQAKLEIITTVASRLKEFQA